MTDAYPDRAQTAKQRDRNQTKLGYRTEGKLRRERYSITENTGRRFVELVLFLNKGSRQKSAAEIVSTVLCCTALRNRSSVSGAGLSTGIGVRTGTGTGVPYVRV